MFIFRSAKFQNLPNKIVGGVALTKYPLIVSEMMNDRTLTVRGVALTKYPLIASTDGKMERQIDGMMDGTKKMDHEAQPKTSISHSYTDESLSSGLSLSLSPYPPSCN